LNRKYLKNVPASIRQRLLNKAKADNRPFQEILQYYAMERFLYRMSQSPHADRFILKGALLLRIWQSPQFRPTMDIDLLGNTSNEEAILVSQILEIISTEVAPDGLTFLPWSVTAEQITADARYQGVRIQFTAELDTIRLNMQIDIGFGDLVFPSPERLEMPTILDSPSPRMLCYSRESVIAEKFEAMLVLRELNSRMKDFHDIWLLSSRFNFDGERVAEALYGTLKQRRTELPLGIVAFSRKFMMDKQVQWLAFHKKVNAEHVPDDFVAVASRVKGFLEPIVKAIGSDSALPEKWVAPGPWT